MASLLQGATLRGHPREITSRLPGKQNSKKAHLGCHIYGIMWFSDSQIVYTGTSMHETPCALNFCVLWQMILGKATCYSFFNRMISVPSSWAWMLTGSLCSSVGFQRTDKTGVLGPLMAQIFIFPRTCTVLLRGHVHLSQWVPVPRPQHLPRAGSGMGFP